MKNFAQKFGKFLSGMVMPNIGAFIAWGFITALFIPDGWIPNEGLASIHPPILTYLLPILIAAQGGRMVGGDRGRVMGAIAIVGCIAGSDNTMLMAAMAIGPLAGLVIKKFDEAMDGHMPAGFEMLINNFSVGIFGMIMAIIGYYVIGPVMGIILSILTAGVEILMSMSLLPLVAVFIEPAKVLFLNNAINHGIFTPIGTTQALETGKSIMYMLEANPGPGLGVLLAYWMFSKDKMTRDSAPGAIIIHFFGGIHEIYFPYVLMNPMVIIAPIVGNVCAIFFYSITGCGLVGASSPGSIIAFMSMSPRPQMLLTLLGVVIAAGVSFVIASPIIKMSGVKSLEEAQAQTASMKAESKGQNTAAVKDAGKVKKVVFACDAGMGSSAMGATKFRNRVKASRPDLTVINTSVDNIPADCDIAVVQTTLVDRAKKSAPQAQMVTIGNFLADPALDSLYIQLTTGDQAVAETAGENTDPIVPTTVPNKKIMIAEGIQLNQTPGTKEEAIQAAGELMCKLGYVDETYVDAMQEREKLVTTYMGMGIAIPHGTTQAKGTVKKTGIVLFQYPEGVPFGDEKANLVFGIAGIGDEHLDLLAKICEVLEDETVLEEMKTTNDVEWILKQLT
ncbi:MAG: PTS mannitol transporter subunit IICBA [Lachnospiraceae bacterium]|jgi:PTS system mannitol-specific IIC component|nr:PTS mannitol transporter subunit IICBA [Lachnospiraceae bacterium]MCI9599313.1 PTS mannitol transporter subunit IICBA [Lachnospiraceae bacterium]MDE6895535.1 PTS mannitol transporter subunit IICBA [Lachnospiraceae bacterium]